MRREGFTLLEVLVATMILALAVVAVFGAQSNAIATRNFIEDMTVAEGLARCRMSEIEISVRDEGGFQEADVEEEGPCCEMTERTDFTCRWKIEQVNLPDFVADVQAGSQDAITKGVGLAFGEKAASRLETMGGFSSFVSLFMPMLSNILTQGIRRVTVAVQWERGERQKDFTITQFIVNPSQGGLALISAAAQMQAQQSAGGGGQTTGTQGGASGGASGGATSGNQ